jgi:hypothetical protein
MFCLAKFEIHTAAPLNFKGVSSQKGLLDPPGGFFETFVAMYPFRLRKEPLRFILQNKVL